MTTTTKQKTYSSTGSGVQFQARQEFDPQRMRHYVNGKVTVLHCHHYSTLFTQLAMDASDFGGVQALQEAARETFYPVLRDYYRENGITDKADRIAIAEQYGTFLGLGAIEFQLGDAGGTATMKHSHVDEGWLKKWGQHDKPVNHLGQGFIKAACAGIFDCDPNSIRVEETQSIVRGASTSNFNLSW